MGQRALVPTCRHCVWPARERELLRLDVCGAACGSVIAWSLTSWNGFWMEAGCFLSPEDKSAPATYLVWYAVLTFPICRPISTGWTYLQWIKDTLFPRRYLYALDMNPRYWPWASVDLWSGTVFIIVLVLIHPPHTNEIGFVKTNQIVVVLLTQYVSKGWVTVVVYSESYEI